MLKARPLSALLPLSLILVSTLSAQQADSSLLSLDRIFSSDEFTPERLGPVRWLDNAAAYIKLEADSTIPGGRSLVRYDAATGKREVWVPANRLVPKGDSVPLVVDDYSVSADGNQLLVFTNSKKVWRENTRGDFWALDLAGGRLHRLGGPTAKPSTLMFAKFAPDGGRVAYVRENNLYVENLADGRITQLTKDGSRTIINGTFDWV
ncbi:MAG: DPP IV N-terminal domain-containing protein, partial [Gemmatimonadales bacterium]